MHSLFDFADEFGPTRTIHICRPSLGLKAIVTIDNTACGPAVGGVRMAPDVSLEECLRLARAMTWKNAAGGLPHGGGKSVIVADPKSPATEKEALIRAFAQSIADLEDYIPGPDMGTDETCMAWIKDETGRAVGLPSALGGIPLDEIGATGFGLASCIDVARTFTGFDIKGARFVVQGFGAVGKHAARFLAAKGAILIGASDSTGALIDRNGLPVQELIDLKDSGRSLHHYSGDGHVDCDALIDVPCDIWIPAARPDVIRADNVARLKTRMVVEGANIPLTLDAEQALHKKGVIVVPDFIANAGGVMCASIEYRGGTQRAAFEYIDEKIQSNTHNVLELSRRTGVTPRIAAQDLARARILAATATRRWR
jgi:glutamate dehydrogenase/leucine dehydrogenase